MRFIDTGEFRNIDLADVAGLCIGDVGEPFQFGRKIGEAPIHSLGRRRPRKGIRCPSQAPQIHRDHGLELLGVRPVPFRNSLARVRGNGSRGLVLPASSATAGDRARALPSWATSALAASFSPPTRTFQAHYQELIEAAKAWLAAQFGTPG